MNSQSKPESLGKSPMKRTPPSLPSQEIVEERMRKALEEFKQENRGKTWAQIADEMEAEARGRQMPETLGESPMKDMPPSWKAGAKDQLAKAIEQFKKDTAGKSWDDLADELEAKVKAN